MLQIHIYVLSLIVLTFLAFVGLLLCNQPSAPGAVVSPVQKNIRRLFFWACVGWIVALLLMVFWGLQVITALPIDKLYLLFQLGIFTSGLCLLGLIVAVRKDTVAKWGLISLIPVTAFYAFLLLTRQSVVSCVWPVTDFYVVSNLAGWADWGPLLPWGLAAVGAVLLMPSGSRSVFVPIVMVGAGLGVFLGIYDNLLPQNIWLHPLLAVSLLILGLGQLLPAETVGFGHFRPLAVLRLFNTRLSFKVGGTFVLMVIILLEALNFFSLQSSQGELLQTRSAELMDELKTVETAMGSYMRDSKQEFYELSEHALFDRLRLDNANYITRTLVQNRQQFKALAVYQTSGVQMGAFPPKDHAVELMDFVFPRLAQSLEKNTNEVAYAVVEDQYHFLAVPLKDHNHILIGLISLDAFKNQFSSLSLREDTVITVESATGRLLLGHVSTQDRDYLWKTSELPAYQLRVSAGIRMADAYHEIRKAEANGLFLLVVGAMMALLVSMSITRGLNVDLRRLLVGMSIVRGGNLSYHIDARGRDEMSSLATAFNDMTVDLKKAREQVIDLERFRAVHQVSITVNHEINSPLATILMTTQMVTRLIQKHQGLMVSDPAVATVLDKLGHLLTILDKEAKHIRDICALLRDVKSVETAEYLPGHEMLLIKGGAGLVKKDPSV